MIAARNYLASPPVSRATVGVGALPLEGLTTIIPNLDGVMV
jgi:hypothetical protein